MRAAAFALVAVTTTLAAFVACGGPTPPSQTPAAAGAAAPGLNVVVAVGDAGPTSTTTQAVGAGAAAGTKLTPLASGDAGTDGGRKHQGEMGRTLDDIKAILNARHDETRACYDNALANHPGIEGNIHIRWLIDPTGNVKDAELDTSQSEIVEPAVANCLIEIVKKIHFNASAKGFESKTGYLFNFHPKTRHVVTTGDGSH